MASAQQPIGSGFDGRTTAQEVVQALDLSGRTAVVTGGYSGLGLEITRALTCAGAAVIVPARRPSVAAEQLEGLSGVTIEELDLADLESVRRFAERLVDDGRPIDMLVNNAGIMACPETRVRVGGADLETQFATNHLGHFALTNRLWPLLADGGGARVVSVSSAGHKRSPVRFDDLGFARGYDKWEAYGQSKTANVLFAVQLDTLGAAHGVRAFSLHPGGILTPLQRHLPREEMVALGWIDADGRTLAEFKTPEQGASTATWAATSPDLEGLGGVYLEDTEVARVTDPDDTVRRGVEPYAIDPDNAARLWSVSAELTGVDAFAEAGTA